jgi:hypothetical protein
MKKLKETLSKEALNSLKEKVDSRTKKRKSVCFYGEQTAVFRSWAVGSEKSS